MIRQFMRRLESLERGAKPPMISTFAEFITNEDDTKDLSPEFAVFLARMLEEPT